MSSGINSGDFVEYENEWFVILNPFLDTDPNYSMDIKNIFARSVKTGTAKRLDYKKITNIISSIEVFTNMTHLHGALKDLVKMNEDHNAAVESVIGRPLNWSDSYLDKARTAIIYTDAMYDKNKHK